MREAIGGTWLFQIVIVFILLFTGFMCLSINRSKAFNVKNYIVETIQSYNGELTDSGDAMKDIVNYMKQNSYRTTGVKPPGFKIGPDDCKKTAEYSCFNREGKQDDKNSPVFCVAKVSVDNVGGCLVNSFEDLPSMYYWRVVVFYQLDLPFFHDFFNFEIVGDTKLFSRSRGV